MTPPRRHMEDLAAAIAENTDENLSIIQCVTTLFQFFT